ncbi:MAG: DNA repair protein RecN [Planctomycetota bacterium]|jgi:DNA repair protein RecN (Recombination protein N)|nr:DNA repair protein RecN [Planctomycetota bacterium]
MLAELQVKNYGLIDSLGVEFHDGLNVISGETGVGKSMLISAIKFLQGARANSSMVRQGSDECSVTGVFLLNSSQRKHLKQHLDDEIFDVDEIILRRSLKSNGRNRCTVNDQLVTAGRLGEIARSLVELHGQHEEQALLDPDIQLLLLDEFGRCVKARETFQESYQKWLSLNLRQQQLEASTLQRKQQIELLKFQHREITESEIRLGEFDELQRQQDMFSQMQEILRVSGAAQDELVEAEGSVIERIHGLRMSASGFEALHPLLAESLTHLDEAALHVQEASTNFSRFCYDQEYEPQQLEEIQARLDELTRLRMKYGNSEAEVLSFAEEAEKELARLANEQGESENIHDQLDAQRLKAEKLGDSLHRKRVKAAKKLGQEIAGELKHLGMPKSSIEIELERHASLEESDETGLNQVAFGFCANRGEQVLPLAEVASGGEVSRVFLAIKSILAAADLVPVLVFDEIDSNVGGRLGSVVGGKLGKLSENHQLICVTHLPQIASFANHHIKIFKQVKGGRTLTRAVPLGEPERLEELAEMIRGSGVTKVTLAEAREMLAEAASMRRTG